MLAVALLILEIFALRYWFTTDHLVGLDSWWTRLLVLTRFGMPFSLCVVGGMGLVSGRQFLIHFQGAGGAGSCPRSRFPWLRWFSLHVLSYGACLALAAYLFQSSPAGTPALGLAALGFGLAMAALIINLLSLVVPLGGLLMLVREQRSGLLLGALGGVLAYAVGNPLLGDMPYWRPMGAGTMWLAYQMLGLVYSERILEPQYLRLGTSEFDVMISRWCSGYEGVFLFLGFFSLFLFLSRRRLRFPQVLWLLPVGVVSVYFLNALRIALLVVVGTEFSDELAMEGFHVNAGWPFFAITAWLSVTIAMRSSRFSKPPVGALDEVRHATVNLYGVYLAPVVLSIAAVMLAGSLTRVEWVGDVAKLLAVGGIILVYRHEYRGLLGTVSFWGVLFGLFGYGAWCLLYRGEPSLRWLVDPLWPRIVGYVLITPFAEELLFRGFLMRRLVSAKFESVSVMAIGAWPLIFSSLAFGLLHQQWIAASACGLIFGLAYRLRGRLGDALLAHVLTNAVLVANAIRIGDWGLVG